MDQTTTKFEMLLSPRRLFLRVMAAVFLVELSVMLVLLPLSKPFLSGFALDLLDSTALTLLLSPLLWWWIVRPLGSAMHEIMLAANVINASVDAIITFDDRGRITAFNPAAARLFGYAKDEAIGHNVKMLMPPTERKQYHEHLGRYLRTGEKKVIGLGRDLVAQRKDGVTFPIHLSLSEARDRGRPLFTGIVRDLTDSKRAEEALRESEERLRLALDAAHLGTFDWDVPHNRITWSRWHEELWGFKRGEFAGTYEAFSERVHADDVPGTNAEVARCIAAREPFAREFRVVWPDGSVHWVHARGEFTFGEDGEPSRMRGAVMEITERKQAEEQIRRQLDFTETITTSLGEGLYALDSGGRVTFMNPAAEAALGWSEADLLGQKIHPIIHFQHADGTPHPAGECPLLAVLKSGHTVKTENDVFTRKDGSMFSVSYTSSPIITAGKVVGAVNAFRDITERKRTEEQLRITQFSMEHAGDPIFWIRPDASVMCVNQATSRLFGYSQEELLTMSAHDVNPTQPPAVWAEHWRELQQKKLLIFETNFLAKDGQLIPVEVTANHIEFENQEFNCAFVRDISERKQAAETLRESEAQLRQAQKMEAIGQLAGGIAHDFNNLLTAINGYSSLASRRIEGNPMVENYLEEIKKAGDRAANLTRQLLAFGRKQILQPLPLSLNDVVSDMNKMLQRLIGEDIQFNAKLTPDLKSVEADPGQIEQVLVNLVVNARDAMPHGGSLTIETANAELDREYASTHVGAQAGAFVVLAVSDTGTGMDEEVRRHIFEPFFTTKEEGKGTGLGLSTVYGIVKQSGGNIWVYSEPNQGTTFKVYLPAFDSAPKSSQAKTEESVILGGSETIMLVEDEEAVRGLAHQILEQAGYQVLVARQGEEAIRLGDEHAQEIHLLLTDVVMPGAGGKEVADRLSLLRPGIKVLFMSGYTDEAIVHHGVLDSGVEFIQKPFTPASLARKVREVLGSEPPAVAGG